MSSSVTIKDVGSHDPTTDLSETVKENGCLYPPATAYSYPCYLRILSRDDAGGL